MQEFVALRTLDELRSHVHETLCSHDHLDPAQTPLYQTLIFRREQPCGMLFRVHGPRLLKTYAIWAAGERRILFYDSNGQRFGETRLSASPTLPKLVA